MEEGEGRGERRGGVQAARVGGEVGVARPDRSAAVREIRVQYERLANNNMRLAEDWYQSKLAGVAEMASRNTEAVRAVREETMEYRQLLQSRSSEIEGLRNVIESLHKQLDDLEDSQGQEVANYQVQDLS